VDADGDGYTAVDDCDDSNATIFPGAPERCDNGRDNDCDGLTYEPDSEDAVRWYIDADHDGFGSPDFVERSCVQPRGWVSTGDDCDDADASTFPGAAYLEPTPFGGEPYCMRDLDGDGYGDGTPDHDEVVAGTDCDDEDTEVHPDASEVCDGVDTDCDGGVEAAELDQDGDSFVVCARSEDIPWRGEGTVTDGGDCNDNNANSFPGMPETCADDFDNDCDGFINEADAFDAPMWFRDADGDGYGRGDLTVIECDPGDGWSLIAGDCNDLRNDVSPLGTEVCDDDDEDEDCDGLADGDDALGPSEWYRDADGDGWGDASSTFKACNQPAGYVEYTATEAVDCDDSDASVAPGEDEVCNDIDDDCDGEVDEDDAVDATTWYLDDDDDGYGVADSTTVACEEPAGFADNTDDCDDSTGTVNPDQDEVCDDADVDEDCDGLADDSSAVDAVLWYVDYDGDGFGVEDTTSAILSCSDDPPSVSSLSYVMEVVDGDGDGDEDDEDGFDCDDAEAARNPAASDTEEACFDSIQDNDCNDETTCALSATYTMDAVGHTQLGSGALGSALLHVENHDGAGTPAVLASEPGNGRASLYVLESAGFSSVASYNFIDESHPAAIASGELYSNGSSDLVFGLAETGAAYLIYGPLTGAATSADVTFSTSDLDYTAGSSVAVIGDLDGNGTPELAISGLDDSDNGRVWLLDAPFIDLSLSACAETTEDDTGSSASSDDTQVQCSELITSTEGDGFGTLVASSGDLNADGRDELLVTAPDGDAGIVYLLAGPISGTTAVDVDATQLVGEITADRAGASVSGGADMDGDGYNDLLVGAPAAGLSRGEAYLVRGPISANVALQAADVVFTGTRANDGAGGSVSFAGDLNGDGNEDIAIGAPDISTVWVVYGPVSGAVDLSNADITVAGESASSQLGAALLGPGDVGSAWTNDLYIGEPAYSAGAGQVGVLLGVLP
jgi:hypothetical protein